MQDILAFIQNHMLLNSVFIIVLFCVIVMEFIRQKQSATNLTPTKLTQLINHQNPVIIDIRDLNAYTQGHVIGALSFSSTDIDANPKKIEKFRSRPLVLICATGVDSSRLATKLLAQGFETHVLRGGMRAWRDADMPTVKE